MAGKGLFGARLAGVAGLVLFASLTNNNLISNSVHAAGADPAEAAAVAAAASVSPPAVRYKLEVPGRGEIFPAFASAAPAEYWPVAVLTIANTSGRPVMETVSAEIHDWSRPFAHTVTLGPNETQVIRLNPELLPQAYENGEIRPATLEVRAGLSGAAPGYDETRPVYLHSASDFFWGDKLTNSQLIARWVTPHDPAVLQLVSSARSYIRRGRLAGYEMTNPAPAAVAAQVQEEARAVFQALQHLGVSYVDSISSFGHFAGQTERVRLPRETLTMNGANCIDLSVTFASAMENLGLEPLLVLVPGHAFTGVRLGRDSSQILYLDLTVLPDGTFDSAVARAQSWLTKTAESHVNRIDIAEAREHQIYPMPNAIQPPALVAPGSDQPAFAAALPIKAGN